MNTSSEHHLEYLKAKTVKLMDIKYRAGQKEHGGTLRDVSAMELLDNGIDEAIDQIVYLLTLKEKLND
jgi:hypothetical protein